MDTVEITELEKIDATRVDGVGTPANGIPILLMKALAPPAEFVKGRRDCPECDKSYDADHKGENCGAKLPAPPASKAADDKVDCPTCKGDGKIRGNSTDCPDCDASGKVTSAKAKTLAAKSLVKMLIAVPSADPVVLLKAVGADGEVDEQPDIDGGTKVLAMIADLIASEASELKAGQAGEISDIIELAYAAQSIWCWRTGEQAVSSGSVMPAEALMQSAMTEEQLDEWAAELVKADMSTKDINDLPDSAFAYIEPGGTKDAEGKTTPRSKRHFPVHDKAHAANALSRAPQSPFGDKAMPKIKAAAKKFGIGDDASKSQIAEEGPVVDTVTQGTGDLEMVVEAAVTKAVQPHKERIEQLEAELAKVKATPVPGGPMMSVARPAKAADDDHAAKAAYYERMADSVASPQDADGYRQLASQERAKISAPA